MKNIKQIILTSLFLISSVVFAQERIKPIENALPDSFDNNPNTYYKDTNNKLQNCVGTWKYDNGIDVFIVTFTKVKEQVNEKYKVYRDVLKAKFFYSKNGTVIYDNLNTTPGTGANTKASIISSGFVKNSNISFIYDEPSFTECHRRKSGYLSINIITTTPRQLKWVRQIYLGSSNYPCDNGAPIDDSPFLIPANMVLIKQP